MKLVYKQNFELAGRRLLIQVKAEPEWVKANESRSQVIVPLAGALLTFLLLVYLRRLLGRSALADTLEVAHAIDQAQRRAAEALAAKLSLVVEQNPATIIIMDLEARIEYVNDHFIETTGYAREEAIGQHVETLLNPHTQPESLFEGLRASLAGGQSWTGELQTRRRDGSLFWERALIAPIRDAEGKVTNYVAIKEDISALREVMTQLQESENRFRSAMAVMLEGLVILSPDGEYVFVNRSAQESIGHDVLGRQVTDLGYEIIREDGSPCPPDEYPSHRTLRDGSEIRDAVIGFRVPGGAVRWTEINTSPLHVAGDPRWGAVLTFSDVTERRRTEEQLKLAFEAIKHSGEGILVTDAEHRILSANPAFEAMTGYRTDEIIGAEPSVISLGESGPEQEVALVMREALATTGYWQGEVWNRRRSGEGYPGWLGVSVVHDADNRPKYYIYIFSDITERKEAQKRIEYLAHHDALTGLPNRLLLCDRMAQAQAQAHRMQSRVALMFLDLDRFKTINDSLGHPVGDALLKEIVERLKGCVRESDTISRQGGDEFIILLNDVRDGEAIARVADKIHQRMADPIVLGSHTLNTSFSIGIAIYPDDGSDFDTLLQKADTAMYHAKEAGRNSHRFFTEQMNRRVVEHLSLETSLRRALDNKEFVLHYQPQMDLGEGRIVGVEALVRWNHPEQGLISPARFIPVAEDSGLIVPLGAWVLSEACRQARAWQDAGLPPIVVAVNLSAVQFRRPDLVNTVINALVLSDLDSQWLELELTESILIQDAEATLDTVRRLKSLGIKLSVDDFGTGYSSLTYLKRFAVDKLKIDQSFVRDLVSDPDDAAIVRAIIQMAHSLKLKTIAEGVESEELANLLRIFHCDEIQGYWLARPMSAEQMEAFLRERAG
ncbi:MAG: EAL domain-containing protein [Propionivibrio sp.]